MILCLIRNNRLGLQRRHERNLFPFTKLLEVLEAQVALGKEGAQSAVDECRELILKEIIDQLAQPALHSGELFGPMFDLVTQIGFHRDGSGHDDSYHSLYCIGLPFLRQRGMLEQAEAMQRAIVERQSLVQAQSIEGSAAADASTREGEGPLLLARGRLVGRV